MNEELKHGTWKPISKQHGNATDGYWTENTYSAQYAATSVETYLFQSISRLIVKNVGQKWMEVKTNEWYCREI